MTASIIDSKLFSSLLHSPLMASVFNDQARVARYVEVEAALARAQAKAGMIPQQAAVEINKAANEVQIDMERLTKDTGIVGYPILGLVRQLSEATHGDAKKYVHWGATTQDIMDTATVLQVKAGIELIEQDLQKVINALSVLAKDYRDTVMAGRTHLQHALPITFGYKAAVWLDSLLRSAERLANLKSRCLLVQLGGASGTLASMGEGAEKVTPLLAEELGLISPDIPWHAMRDTIAEVGCSFALITGSLSKIAMDIMLMMMTELSEVAEPFVKDRGASSTMPQKKNPISCEVIRGCHRGVSQAAHLLLEAQETDFERATGPWHVEWTALPEVFVLTHCSVSQAVFLLEGLQVDAEKMHENLEKTNGMIVAESVMMNLAPFVGRQVAHDVVYDACREADSTGVNLFDVLVKDSEVSKHLSQAELKAVMSPENYLGLAKHYVDNILLKSKSL